MRNPPLGTGGRGNDQGHAQCPDSTRRPATPQDELATAERIAFAEREAIRAAITAYNRRGPNLAGELKRLYDEADRRLADVRKAIREQGRR